MNKTRIRLYDLRAHALNAPCFCQWKQRGNTAFSAGDFELAIECYTNAINMASKNDTNYSNRSAARLKAGDLDGPSDANKCIALNQRNHKGYGRKGAAYLL
jgi:stress-induced-phosphoprotein 1